MKIIEALPNENPTIIKIRTEETSTQLFTCYYEVEQILPFGWGRMEDDEKQHWLKRNATMVSREIEDVKSNIDGVFNSWGNSDPEYTVTFTYTASEVVNAASKPEAVAKARKIMASFHQTAESVLLDADINISGGRDGF